MCTYNLIARYRDDKRSLCEFRGSIAAASAAEAKREFARQATAATGFPTLLVLTA